jgi:streptomycin 6-kinase
MVSAVSIAVAGVQAFAERPFDLRDRAWIARLPSLVDRYRHAWRLEIEHVLVGGVMSCCLAVRTASGQPAVLKLAGPRTPARPEIMALTHWAGGPAPSLLVADDTGGAMLLERVVPGRPCGGGADELDLTRVAQVLRALHTPPASAIVANLRSLADAVEERIAGVEATVADRALEDAELISARLGEARRITAALLRSWRSDSVVLHGDFEGRNILTCARRGLVAIDPIPSLGDPAYDAAYFATRGSSPIGGAERCTQLARELQLDPARVRRWAAVVALTSEPSFRSRAVV